MFDEKIEYVLEFSKARGLQFGAGQLAVNAVEHFHGVGQHNAETQPAVEKQGGNERAEEGSKERHLIRRNTPVAEPENQAVFEHGIEQQGRQIEGAFLRGTDEGSRRRPGICCSRDHLDVKWYGTPVCRAVVI